MRKLIFLAVLFAAASCKKEAEFKAGDQPYFLFDQVEHFHTDLTQAQLEEIYDKQPQSRKDMGMVQIVKGPVPTSVRDQGFIENMSILGFAKKEIPASENEKISEIFSLKESAKNVPETDCKYMYNDVLLFRQKGQLTGVAKISFDCKKQQMVGIRYNPANFGANGEYEKLAAILKK